MGNHFSQISSIDVKFRTNELNSADYVWKEGLDKWRKIYEVEELKSKLIGNLTFTHLLIESKNEVLDIVGH